MEYTLKKYKNFTYIEYFNEKSEERFTNAEYFIFELNDTFDEIMHNVGGFTAEMTTRMIEKFNHPCKKIMLCQSPCKNNTFCFQFVYFGPRNEIFHIEWDNNYFDYEYFKKKFADCIVEEGWIFDLLKHDNLKEVWKKFEIPTIYFDINVNRREIDAKDTLICKDLCFLKEEYLKFFKDCGVVYAKLTHDYDCLNGSHFKAKFIKEDGSLLPKYQGYYNCKTIEEFRKEYGEEDNWDIEPFEASISTSIVRQLANHFEYSNRDKGDIEL